MRKLAMTVLCLTCAALAQPQPKALLYMTPSTDSVQSFLAHADKIDIVVFYTDARTFKERLDLVRTQGLEGFCSWVLGQEDPAIWNELPRHN